MVEYYRLLAVVLASLVSSVIIQGSDLLNNVFFISAYIAMGSVLVIGTKFDENYKVDATLGMILLFAIGVMSTDLIVGLPSGTAYGTGISQIFRFIITIALDYCALGFLIMSRDLKNENRKIGDGSYGYNR